MSIFKAHKKIILLFSDIILINLSYLTAFYFRFLTDIPRGYLNTYLENITQITSIYIITFFIFKLYNSLWSYAGIDEFMISIVGCIVANVLVIFYGLIFKQHLPYGVSILAGIFSIIYVVGFRISFRVYRRLLIILRGRDKNGFKNVMIIGAGSAAEMLLNEIKKRPEMKLNPIALIDDSPFKKGKLIHGVPVMGGREEIVSLVKTKTIDEIIIAIPSLSAEERKKIVAIVRETSCKMRLLPGMEEIIEGRVSIKTTREVQIEDLLGRETISLDNEGISEYIGGKTVLVTGGGGSIGSELCRQIARFKPKHLLILDIYENNAYEIQNELIRKFPELDLKVLIATVRDKLRLEKIFQEYRPQVVFHAAAHKHVPLMEESPSEAIKNNVFGTLNTAECADKYGVEKFVLISTDKAVNPTNIMGASKRMCEMVIQAMDKVSKTEFGAVRFGNVLGSNGSVIPLFKKQIANGGPVTLTHKDITRFFMTIPEAAQLVLQAGAYAEGGEIFVLDMGKPVKIYDLACDLIRLSGYEPHKDIEIEVTGLRPGEKLYEELLMAEEGLNSTRNKKIFVGRPTFTDINRMKRAFDDFRFIIEKGTKEDLICKIEEVVPTYKRTPNDGGIADESVAVELALGKSEGKQDIIVKKEIMSVAN
jgi:FlaA1/EpsC-like NDP-sugar epimerase